MLPELAPWHKTEHVLLLSVYLASGDRRANRVWVCVKNIQRQIRPGRKSRRRERDWHGASQRGRPEHCTLFTCRFIRRVSYQRSDGKLLCVWSAVVASLYTNENLISRLLAWRQRRALRCMQRAMLVKIYESLLMIGQAFHLFNRNG